jgi:hypothetical protein
VKFSTSVFIMFIIGLIFISVLSALDSKFDFLGLDDRYDDLRGLAYGRK